MKKLIAIVLVIMFVAALVVGCAADEAAAPTPTPGAQTETATPEPATPTEPAPAPAAPNGDAAPVEIRAAWWGDTGRHELYGSIIDLFMDAFPHVTVIQEPTSWTDYWDRLTIQAAGGNAPDFMGMHPQFVADYAARGVLLPLQPLINDGTIDVSGWEQSVVNSGIVNNELIMLSMGITFSSTFINVGMLNELGVDVPTHDWTWDDLRTIGIQAREAFDERGERFNWLYVDSSGELQLFRQFTRQRGRELYYPNGDIQFTVQDAEDWFNLWVDLRELNLVPDAATTAEFFGATLEDSLFARGMVLGTSIPVNQFNLFVTTFPDKEIEVIRNPVNPAGQPGELVEGAHFAIASASTPERQLAAAQLMNFWLNTPEALAIFGLDQGVPGNLELSWAYMDILTPPQMRNVAFSDAMSALPMAPGIFPPAGAGEINSFFQLVAEEVRFGLRTPADAAQALVNEANAIRAAAG